VGHGNRSAKLQLRNAKALHSDPRNVTHSNHLIKNILMILTFNNFDLFTFAGIALMVLPYS
jgi:hypothetical protein